MSNDTILLDPDVLYGKLPNGFTYYIRNSRNTQKVFANLVVKAGINQEDPDQMELAHLLEHMPFVGTRHFDNPRNYFESKGILRGRDFNGSTAKDQTNFHLTIPSGQPELMKDALQFLRDCAHDISLDPVKIDIERGVVLGEIMIHSSSDYLDIMNDQYAKEMGNRINPESKRQESLKTFRHESLFRFYNDWYRPDLQAIIIVGNVNVGEVEKSIKSLFSDLKNPAIRREIDNSSIVAPANKFILLTHEEMRNTIVKISLKYPPKKIITFKDFTISVIEELYDIMMHSRLSELQEDGNVSLRSANSSFMNFTEYSTLQTQINISDSPIKQSFKGILTELERVRRYGFTANELLKAKQEFSETHLNSHNHQLSLEAENYTDHFVKGNAAPGTDFTRKMQTQLLEQLTPDDVNRLLSERMSERDYYVAIRAPENSRMLLPDKAAVESWIAEVKAETITPYRDKEVEKILISSAELAKINSHDKVKKTTLKEIGVTRLDMKNGIKVFLKPVKGETQSGQVDVKGFSRGGISLYEGADQISAQFATQTVQATGLGNFTASELRKFLDLCGIEFLNPYILNSEEGVYGSGTSASVETLLLMIHLYFMNPRMDQVAFDRVIDSHKKIKQRVDPMTVFRDTINNTINQSHIKTISPLQNLDQIDFQRACTIYRERFNHSGDFTFIISGDFDIKKIEPLVARYLGSLPNTKQIQRPLKNTFDHASNSPVSKTVYAGNEDRTIVEFDFVGNCEFNAANRLKLNILRRITNEQLNHRLRVKEGGTYYVNSNVTFFPGSMTGKYNLTSTFYCAVDNQKKMISSALEEFTSLRAKGPHNDTFERAIVLEKNEFSEKKTNGQYWMAYLYDQLINEKNLLEITEFESMLNGLTPELLQKAAQQWLTEDKLMQFVLNPVSYKPAKDPLQDTIILNVFKTDQQLPDWENIRYRLKQKYLPEKVDSAIKVAKIEFYQNDVAAFETSVVDYMNSYLEELSLGYVNDYAWYIFEKSNNREVLEAAAKWIRYGLENKENDGYIKTLSPYLDTFANLIYKLGRKEEAIQWQEKAVADSPDRDRKAYQSTLDKMRAGKKTWK